MLSAARPSSAHSFDPAQMSRSTITLSAAQDKLVLGGNISRDANTGLAALAQIDIVSE